MNILDKIIVEKKKEVAHFKPLSSIAQFEERGFFWQIANRSLVQSLLLPGSSGIIAEFKRRSPSKGWFKPKEIEVEAVVVSYNKEAAGLSILTDELHFGGDLDDLIQAKVISDIPVLRKDFIIDQWQIAEAKAFGADVILLIAACLSKSQVKEYAGYAKSIGLETILELHQEDELDHICEEVDIIGINNRNLDTFEVDMNTSFNLVKMVDSSKVVIAESGISNLATIRQLRDAGFKGFLIGEMFMKEADPGDSIPGFYEGIKI